MDSTSEFSATVELRDDPPDLSQLSSSARSKVQRAGTSIILKSALTRSEREELRSLKPSDPHWQWVVDRLTVQHSVFATTANDGYPSTLWGLLLVDLTSGEDEHWRKFMNRYRQPIANTLRSILSRRGVKANPESVADEFFGWFFDKEIHRKLHRCGPDGRVFRFRGYLKKCLWTFVREQQRPARERHLIDGDEDDFSAAEPTQDLSDQLDRELCRSWVEAELEYMERNAYSLWAALRDECSQLTLDQTAARLRDESDGEHGSVTAAHRLRKKAREAFRRRLVQLRIRQTSVSEEEATDELFELSPGLAEAIQAVFRRGTNSGSPRSL